MFWLLQGPAAELLAMNKLDEIVAFPATLEVNHQVIGGFAGVLLQLPFYAMQTPWGASVRNRKDPVDTLVHFKDKSRGTRTAGKIYQNTATINLVQGLNNRCCQNGIAEWTDANHQYSLHQKIA